MVRVRHAVVTSGTATVQSINAHESTETAPSTTATAPPEKPAEHEVKEDVERLEASTDPPKNAPPDLEALHEVKLDD
jgi:hypothetical protein